MPPEPSVSAILRFPRRYTRAFPSPNQILSHTSHRISFYPIALFRYVNVHVGLASFDMPHPEISDSFYSASHLVLLATLQLLSGCVLDKTFRDEETRICASFAPQSRNYGMVFGCFRFAALPGCNQKSFLRRRFSLFPFARRETSCIEFGAGGYLFLASNPLLMNPTIGRILRL